MVFFDFALFLPLLTPSPRQFFTKTVVLQWPFAFAAAAIVFIASLATAVPGVMGTNTGNEATGRGRGERAPPLHEETA